jgi:hypothetical protein
METLIAFFDANVLYPALFRAKWSASERGIEGLGLLAGGIPQGLKPSVFCGVCGTAKAVP